MVPLQPIDTEALRTKVQFKTQNFIESVAPVQGNMYEVVLCLSTVKWIHFNFGDAGVKTLFLKVYEQLSPGGLFVFEA